MAEPPKRSHPNAIQVFALFLSFIMVSAGVGVLSAGFALPFASAVGATADAGMEVFNEPPEDLDTEEMSGQTVMKAKDGTVISRLFHYNRIPVTAEQISPLIGQAVVAVEDKRFYEHGGVDPEGLARALVGQVSGTSNQGGSTITQQYIKNVRIEAGRITEDKEMVADAIAHTLGRKIEEAKLAIQLEKTKTKEEILVGYLNIAQFGPSQWGVETASQYYFSHSANEATPAEAAMLAGITQAPNKWDPVRNPDGAKFRRDTVLRLMYDQEVITKEAFDEAVNLSIEDMLSINPQPNGCAASGSAAYFCDYVTQIMLTDPAFGETSEERSRLLYKGGLTITTTLDLDLQGEAVRSLLNSVPENDVSGISNSLSTVEPGTGEILVMAQNTSYGKPSDEFPRRTELNFNTDQEFGGSQGFQTGSTFKAIVVAEWLRTGHSLMDMVDSSNGQVFPRASWDYHSCGLQGHAVDYPPKNIEGIGSGRTTVLKAFEESINTTFANMANQMDMCGLIDTAEAMGVRDAGGRTWDGRVMQPNPSLVLGSGNQSPLGVAATFATFPANGVYCTPVAIKEVLDSNGESIPVPESDCNQALPPDVAATTTYAMQRVVEHGTAKVTQLPGRPVAGKTGTANEDTAAWFVGFVPQMSTAVWTGYTEGLQPMWFQEINGRYHRWVYGASISAPVWKDFMAVATDGLEVKNFPNPDEKLQFGEKVNIPQVHGMSISDATKVLDDLGFGVRIGEARYSNSAPEGSVSAASPGSGSKVQQGSMVTLIPSRGPEPPPPEPDPEPEDNESSGEQESERRPGDRGGNRGPGNNPGNDGNNSNNGGGNN